MQVALFSSATQPRGLGSRQHGRRETMKRWTYLLCACGLVTLFGCSNWSRNEEVIDSIRSVNLVEPDGIQFKSDGGERSGGTAAKLSYLRITGDVVSTDGADIPADFVEQVAKRIETHLKAQGCTITGGGIGQGISPTDPVATVCYSLNGSAGQVNVWLIHRVGESQGIKVLGRLMVTVYEAR
jgi:hypothetical protein